MTEELDFSIPSRNEKRAQSGSRLLVILMMIVLIAVLANMGILLIREDRTGDGGEGTALSVEQSKDLALKLEKQGLGTASAEAWKEYLALASPNKEDTARIWYRIGKIYQQESKYGLALSAFYRSESFAKPDDISSEIARRTQECLEAMGKFAALHYELADRVGTGTEKDDNKSDVSGDQIVAEIGPQKIMKSDLDRRIEKLIEAQMSQFASYLTEEQARKNKEELLKQYSTDKQRRIFLEQYIIEELLYRRARESGLAENADVRTALRDMERSVLAEKVVERELKNEIKITPADLETYFEANRQLYVQPERARIGHILVTDTKEAQDIRKKLKDGDDFSVLAREFSHDISTAKKGGEITNWIEKGKTIGISGIKDPDTAMDMIFSTDKGAVIKDGVESDKGIHIIKVIDREKERQKEFDEVKNEVALALRTRKEREVQQRLFADLREQYDVVIHNSVLSGSDGQAR